MTPSDTSRSGTVAVLGATGGIGRQVSAVFSRAGHEVLGVARHPAPHAAHHPFVPLDVAAADPAETAALLAARKVELVVNATGGWAVTEEAMHHAHVRLVDRMLAAVAALPTRPRVVHIGSIHEYGFVPPGTAIDETLATDPSTPYARTKLAGSQAVLEAARAGDVDGVVLRAVNVCGPYPSGASFLGAVLQRLRAVAPGERLELMIADAARDYIDVRDVASAVLRAADGADSGAVFNIGRGEAPTMRDLVTTLVDVAGFPPETIKETGGPVESKGGGWTKADIRRAERVLGWRPAIGLRDSLRDMWEARD
ncbi:MULTISPECIES: NAD-dependent epimerase/dehydratase family protein [Streptomyces]|uniref:NAD(P)-dependent oxidoreductase n=1 Tax=Streptomyces tsukubensis (strain DSM 42081 / NBRC 108919 / NRRL 18488 / 9993) TaxID=1114943 RepID=I2N5A5_STRT9|nr:MULTISPECIES: NAD(P)-dependent oxidoreductase [Streptomyces]AZK96233.1 NAD-dependent epimerase [Streptomyces tsukubensis]EIF92202.1 nad-dependent epimerase/dehydratase [Streptomyces tsukubensis NRRL18488]MYS67392.1 NAD-dependent epimerase/dehydratase family protein [Streptomyces sp. SID5473]QKM67757.1 NAD(P)-dependent oxidoreductase [Streptomyces tsukubensis NRRL18488]TAI44152.1 NAD(P)-dependent oxidoreductase [Streptomyces tsukubensis]